MKLKELFSAKDMTVGSPWKRIVEFAWPMLLGNLAQQLYNTADSIIVGRYVGDNALAAVGSAGPILNLLLALYIGVSTGAGILVSQHFGAKDRERLSRCIGNCITLSALAALLNMVAGNLLAMPMLRLLNTPETIIAWCHEYLSILFWGSAGFFFYNMFSGILRGMGDSVSALMFLLLAAGLNVVLDILFVARFHMGVAGVAYATLIAQVLSAVCCLIKLLHMREVFDLKLRYLKLKKNVALGIMRVGLPSGVSQAVMSLSMLSVQPLTNSLGELFIACNVIIMRVDGFAMLPNMSFGQAMGVYTGQNVGAGKVDRVQSGLRQGGLIALSFSTLITICLLFFARYLFGFFTDTQELIDLAVRMMRILAAGYIALSVTNVLGGVMRGAGDTVTPMWISMASTLIVRVPSAYLLLHLTKSAAYPNGRPAALYTSLLLNWVLGMLASVIFFRLGRWKKIMQRSIADHQSAGEIAAADAAQDSALVEESL